MEYEHEVEEDDVWNYSASSTAAVHTIDKSKASRSGNDVTVVIASENASHSRRRASPRSGMGILMMRWITEGNDDHRSSVINLNECLGGGGGDFTSNTDTLRCDSYSSSGSDNHRLKKMSQHRGDRNYHHNRCRQQQQRRSGSHPDSSSHHRQTLNRCSSRISSWVTPNNMLMLVVFTVFLLTGNVSCESFGPISSNPSSNNNQLDSEQTKPNKMGDDGTWNSGTTNNNYNARNITLNGYSVLDDINLIDTAPDYFDSYNGGGSDQDNQDWSDDPGKNREHYTHQWAVHILGGPEVARKVAEKHGFQFHGEIFPDYYHLTHARVAKRSIEPHGEYHERLALEPEVRWLKQQTVKRRFKRDFLPVPMALSGPSSSSSGGNGRSGRSRAARRSKSIVLNDPRWPAMWYLNRGEGLDMNVLEAWNDGITGKGIVVTILDDGLEKDHPDIVRNYDPMASFDVNSLDMDPMPTYDLTDSNRHGTRCAGEVAAEANNSICAVGIAFEAGVGGVRMLDGDVTDAVEARSLSHNPQHIDIYSASWGPDDDGKTVDGPGELATRAFMEGVAKGRNGKGSIFVWASGNGGRDHDNCNCDGYTNSIWTLSISSATENGLVPWYSEACSSTLATTYSSGGTGEKQIVTIDLHHSCTSSHTGTSASAPLAAGICALALQANTNLTWRDMQHIVVRTARPQNLRANDWATNGVKRNVSHSFGYGLMDAGAMVKLAKKWKTVPPQHNCEIKAPYTDKNIPSKSKVTLDLKVTNCPNVNYLEHVQAKVTLTSGRRGDLQIFLVSPSGTRSQLLAHRRHDLNRAGFTDWPFMTVHSWGESPIGKWTLEIHNEGRYTGRTVLKRWSLVLYGTEEDVNANYSGGNGRNNKEGKSSSNLYQQQGFSSYVLYTPRNSSVNKSRISDIHLPSQQHLLVVSGGKGDPSNTNGGGGGGNGRTKQMRPRLKGKLLSKKQKGATPTSKPAPPPAAESHVIITSDDEEFRQFLQSKFGIVRLGSSVVVGRNTATTTNTNEKNSTNWTESGSKSTASAAHAFKSISPLSGKEPKDDATAAGTGSTSTLIRASSQEILSSTFTTSSTSQSPLVVNSNSRSSNAFLSSTGDSFTSSTAPPSSVAASVSSSSTKSGGTSASTSTSEVFTVHRNANFAVDGKTDATVELHEERNENGRNVIINGSEESARLASLPAPSNLVNNQTEVEQGKLQTWSLIAHGIASNPNDLVGDSGIGGERNNGGGAEGNGFEASKVGAPAAAVVDQFDGSDNTIAAESPSSSLQNSPPVPANVGVAKPVSIVGRPSSPSQSSVSSDCAKLSAQGQCLECATKSALLHGGCVSQCPQTFYVQSRGQPSLNEVSSDSSSNVHYVCLPCHYSCQTCSGPNDDECISCHEDAKLHRVSVESDPNTTTDKAHCYPTQLLDTLSRSNMSHRILLAIVAVSVVFIIFMLTFLCCDCCRRGRRVGVYKSGFEHEHDKPGWLIKKGQSQPYERIAREEIDEDDDDEFEYYDAYHSKARNLGDRRPQNKQTHLELISEDEDDDGGFEKLNTDFNRSGTVPERKGNHEQSNNSETSRLYTLHHSAGAGVHNVIPPKVPLVLPGSSRKVGESSLDCDQADKGPLV